MYVWYEDGGSGKKGGSANTTGFVWSDGDVLASGFSAERAKEEFDAPLNQPSVESNKVPYEKDRPLTEQELAEAPPLDDKLEDFGGDLDAQEEPEYFGGIRDERDPR